MLQHRSEIILPAEDYERHALDIYRESKQRKIDLRLIGSIAVRARCPQYSKIISPSRRYKDIDFFALGQERAKVKKLFSDLNFEIDKALQLALEETRYAFFQRDSQMRVDVFFDELDFCHRLDLRNRLSVEERATIPLADLLLTKLQIVNLEEKDIEDICVLLLEYPLGATDVDCINMQYISKLLAHDWGFWFTVDQNLDKLDSGVQKEFENGSNLPTTIRYHVETLREQIRMEQKTWRWVMRAKIGTRLKWYRTVDESQIF